MIAKLSAGGDHARHRRDLEGEPDRAERLGAARLRRRRLAGRAQSKRRTGAGAWGNQVIVPSPSPLLRKAFTVDQAGRQRPPADHRARPAGDPAQRREGRRRRARSRVDRLHETVAVQGVRRHRPDPPGRQRARRLARQRLVLRRHRLRRRAALRHPAVVLGPTRRSRSPTAPVRPSKPTPRGRSTAGPIRFDDLYNGEEYDARAELPGWDSPGFDDGAWGSPVVRTARQADPGVPGGQRRDRAAGVPADRGHPAETRRVGLRPRAELHRLGPAAGQRPGRHDRPMRHAEVLNPDGTIYTANLRGARRPTGSRCAAPARPRSTRRGSPCTATGTSS